MMKGKDRVAFIIILIISLIVGIFIFDKSFSLYSEIITFLSIMIGFQITSLSILFNSPLKRSLFDKKEPKYRTELHRLTAYYQHSLFFEVVSILLIFIIPQNIILPKVFGVFIIGKYIIVSPILFGTLFCFYKICKDLFRIFTFPTNE